MYVLLDSIRSQRAKTNDNAYRIDLKQLPIHNLFVLFKFIFIPFVFFFFALFFASNSHVSSLLKTSYGSQYRLAASFMEEIEMLCNAVSPCSNENMTYHDVRPPISVQGL